MERASMKSVYRCKETFQGDRCKREGDHTTASQDNPNVHAGEFTMWNDQGVLLKVQGAQPRKRSRSANRAIRQIGQININEKNPLVRAEMIRTLGNLEKFFGSRA